MNDSRRPYGATQPEPIDDNEDRMGSMEELNFNDNNEKGSEIIVFSANGAKVKSFKVPAGQKTATFNVNGSAGMYLVNRAQNGKANETKKIVIK